MNCTSAHDCKWLERFGIKTCQRLFEFGRCKPIEESDDEEMPEQPNGDVSDEEPD